MAYGHERGWTTLWDRPNRRVLLLAGPGPADGHWANVEHDLTASVAGVYDIWRANGAVVFVQIHLDKQDKPIGFPRDLLDEVLLGSMTLWPFPGEPSFIWWHSPREDS